LKYNFNREPPKKTKTEKPCFNLFIITFREGIEAFLIVAISLVYLRKTGKSHLISAVHWGIAASVIISLLAGILPSESGQSIFMGRNFGGGGGGACGNTDCAHVENRSVHEIPN